MSFLQFNLARCLLSLAIIVVLAFFMPSIRGDEPGLRIVDGCVIPLVRIDPGEWDMGRSSRVAFAAAALSFGEQGDWATEGPVRKVTISRAFLIGKHKITADQYCRFLNSTDGAERFVSINRFSNIEIRDGVYYPKDGRSTFPINVVHWDGVLTKSTKTYPNHLDLRRSICLRVSVTRYSQSSAGPGSDLLV